MRASYCSRRFEHVDLKRARVEASRSISSFGLERMQTFSVLAMLQQKKVEKGYSIWLIFREG